MQYINISDKDRQAIEKKELDEFEQKRLRGTGYDMMVQRDRGWGKIHDERIEGQDVVINWNVEESKRYPYQTTMTDDGKKVEVFPPRIPEGKFLLNIGDRQALIDKNAFEKLLRWV